jgi:hypothetical protein
VQSSIISKALLLLSFLRLPQSLRKKRSLCTHWQLLPETFHGANSYAPLSRYHEGSIPPELSHSDSFRGTCTRSLRKSFNNSQVLNPSTLRTPAAAVFDFLCSDSQLRLLLQPAHSLHGFNNPLPLLGE